MLRSPSPPRRLRAGFTLIELLVVIAIIAVLVGLLLSGVQAVRQRADELKVRADIDKLGQAIASFKTKFNRNPPSAGGGPMGTFRLASYYQTKNPMTGVITYVAGYSDTSPEIVVLRALFGRINLLDNGLRRGAVPVAPDADMNGESDNLQTAGVLPTAPALLDPNQCLVFFLSGGINTGYLGFATSPTMPFSAPATPGEQRLAGSPFFEGFVPGRMVTPYEWLNKQKANFDTLPSLPSPLMASSNVRRWEGAAPNQDTVSDASNNPSVSNEPWFVDPWGTPYFYSAASGIGTGGDYPTMCLVGPWGGKFSGYNRPAAQQFPTPADYTAFPAIGLGAFKESTIKFYNHNGYQIVSAGPNGSDVSTAHAWGFGRNPGGIIVFGKGDYDPAQGAGGDDYTNFRAKRLAAAD